MSANAVPQTIGRRYLLHERLGAGGMGAVYRATDRLTGGAVALKRMTIPADQLAFATRSGDADLNLALALEFRTLASLRHPNIISVLDYGFDERGRPFFTMSLLENTRTVVEAGQGRDLEIQVDLLVQTLRALAYLHRRAVLHRDLKPGNVLVVDGQVKVLDFGVSVVTSRTMEYLTQTTAGTLAYMAPELFQDAPVTRAADLYAVGVMAYEILAGRHPFNVKNVATLLFDVVSRPADVRSIGVGDALATVLERLLAKGREERYDDAEQAIRDLCMATGCSLPAETVEIRESYLQAARFVGREAELGRLSGALDTALRGQGSAWLVGGESGVGKSRLVDELRTLALVRGALVLRGQAVSEGGSLYQLWREVARWLALATDLEEEEASVLNALVPDVGGLLGREVADAPPVDPQTAQRRLFAVLAQVLRRQCESQAVVTILEDLQWMRSDSLALLDHLARGVGDLPLLLVGNYRDDERPHLPDDLPAMQVLKLERLSEEAIAELSVSMLGQAGRREPVLDLLRRETEGNPFFLVEVVRALAEEAGQLERVGTMALPARVFAAGVQELVQRRLNLVPEGARPLLRLAAVVGCEFDLDVLSALAPEADLSRWLITCADRAVLEARDGQWRFVHHKLRDGILDALPDDVRPGLHRQVAETLERAFPDRLEEQVGLLAHHWEQAADPAKAVEYLSRAGDRARLAYANQEAVDYYRRALTFLKEQGMQERAARMLMKLGLTYHIAFDFRRARQAYQEGFALWQKVGEVRPAVSPSYTLRWSWGSPGTLDPTMASDNYAFAVIEQLFSGLLQRSPEIGVVPDVARDWEVSEGGRRYVFHLRDDVRWSDGTPVTAGDFEYAWKRVLDPATDSPNADLLYDIKGARAFHRGEIGETDVGVRALDEATLAVELEGPTGHFLHLLTYTATYPVPRHAVAAHGEAWAEVGKIITNGPFSLESWRQDESMVWSRNPAYHGHCSGNVQQVQLSLLPGKEWSTQLGMYENDDLDVLDLGKLPPTEMERARQRYAGEYLPVPELITRYVGFDVRRPPFDDCRVRRAFVLATDRETLADVLLRGYHFPATGGFVPPGMPGHSPGIGLPYDPERARQLLAEAGYPDGRGFPVVEALAGRGHLRLMEYLQPQWREELSVQIPWQPMDGTTFDDKLRKAPPHIFITGWAADYPDPDNFMRICHFRLFTGWRNDAYDGLVEKARRITEQGERMELYTQADKILVEQAPIAPIIYARRHLLVKPWVTKYPASAISWFVWKDVVIEPH